MTRAARDIADGLRHGTDRSQTAYDTARTDGRRPTAWHGWIVPPAACRQSRGSVHRPGAAQHKREHRLRLNTSASTACGSTPARVSACDSTPARAPLAAQHRHEFRLAAQHRYRAPAGGWRRPVHDGAQRPCQPPRTTRAASARAARAVVGVRQLAESLAWGSVGGIGRGRGRRAVRLSCKAAFGGTPPGARPAPLRLWRSSCCLRPATRLRAVHCGQWLACLRVERATAGAASQRKHLPAAPEMPPPALPPDQALPSQCGSSIIPTWLRTYNMMEHRGHVKWVV